ncbi:MAG: MFS transporter [Promicromonosporaceae bacterium]|nr:MFS transporter [Promicromonosporaceae bacterium]
MPRLLADLTPLRVSPEFRRLFWGLGISNLGSQLTVVAVGLQIYGLTGSTLAVGTLGIFALVPLVALGLYGGALVDRHDRRKVALLSSVVLWAVTIAIALQAWLHVESVNLLYGLVAVQSAATAINSPARTAIVPRLLPLRLMPAANALDSLTFNIALTCGPLAGAGLVAAGGYAWAYTIDALAFAAALWATWRLPQLPPLDDAPRRESGLRSVLDGLRYLGTRPNLRTSFVADLCAMVLAFPRVLWPAAGLVFLGGGAATTGILSAAFAVGGILATLFSGPFGHVHRHGRAVVWAVTGWALSVALFGAVLVGVGRGRPSGVLVGGLVLACLALVLAGGTDAVSQIFRSSILQSAAPDHLRGRLQGVFVVVVAGGPRLGDLWVGAQASWFGEGWAAVAGGLACLVALWIVAWRTPRFWRYDARSPEA